MAFVPGTSSDDIIIPTANGNTYLGGQGNDTYIITKAVAAGATVVITDTEGANKIQLTDGLTVASSTFFADATELTLSNGAKVQITGASKFTFDIGANLTAGDTADTPNQTYAQFANALGVATLPTGNASSAGTPNFVVPTTGVFPTPTFTISGATTGAEGTTVTYTVKLSTAVTTGSTTVNYTTTFLNGASAADITGATTGTLTFAPNETSKTITVPLVLDTNAETTKESIVVTLSSPSVGTAVGSTNNAVTTEITEVPVTYTVAGSDNVFEGANATYTVTASRPVDVDTVVGFVVTPGDVNAANAGTTKTNLADFDQGAFNTFSATIKAGQTTATYTVSALADAVTELEETFSVTPTIAGATVAPKTTILKDGNGSGGKIFTLTTGVDNGAAFTGTAGNDTFNATGTTLTGLDALDGNAGTDTLNVLDPAGNAIDFTLPSSIKNIETLNVESVTGLKNNAADVSGFTGLTAASFTLNNLNATEGITAGATTAVTVNGKVVDGAEALTVTGGSVVTVNETVLAGKAAGTVLVTGTASTVSITETLGVGSTAGATNVTDTGVSATKAGTLTTVTLDGTGAASTIASNALTSLTLKNTGAWAINVTDTLTAHTTAGTTLALGLSGTAAGASLVDTNNTIAAVNITTSTKDAALALNSNTSLKTVTVTGDKNVDLSGSTWGALTSLTATGTAGVKATVGAGVTVTTADGVDQITLATGFTKASSSGAGDDIITYGGPAGTGGTFDAGTGTDTIVMTAAQAVTATADAKFAPTVAGFEVLKFSAATGAAAAINMANADGINSLDISGATVGALTITNAAANFTLTQRALTSFASSVALASDVGTSDNVNLVYTANDGFTSTAAFTIANVESLKITTKDGDTTAQTALIVTPLTAAAASSVTVSGDMGISFIGGLTQTTLTSLDASGLTASGAFGGLTWTSGALAASSVIKGSAAGTNVVDFSAANTASTFVTYTGGTGADTITGSNTRNNVVNLGDGTNSFTSAGAGNNTVTGGSGVDTINVGTGNNTINVGAGADIVTVGSGQNVITLGTGADVLTLSAAPLSGNAYSIVTDAGAGDVLTFLNLGTETFTKVGTLANTAVFQDYLDAATAANITTDANIRWFQFGGNTYVVEDLSAAPTFQNGVDLVLQLTGLIDLTNATGAGTNAITLV